MIPGSSRMLIAQLLLIVSIAARAFVLSAQTSERPARWIAPAEAATRANPLSERAAIVAGGRKLFHGRCAACHGDDGQGTSKGPNLGAAYVQGQTDGALFWKITQGNTRTGMPTFSFLPAPQRWQLVLHLRELRRKSAASSSREDDSRCAAANPFCP